MPEEIRFAVAWAIVILTGGVVVTAVTLARARLKGSAPPAGTNPSEFAELGDAVHRLSGDLAELQERMEFRRAPVGEAAGRRAAQGGLLSDLEGVLKVVGVRGSDGTG